MATFTTPLHRVVELTGNKIGLDEYPIFDDSYRESLNQKIVNHYWNQEIGQETIDLFVFAMRRKMNEIMPLYNQLYESARTKFDPLLTVDIRNFSTNKGTAESSEDSENASESHSESRAVASDFPQNRLAGNKDYATSAQDNVAETIAKGVGKGKSSTVQDGTTESETTGFQGNRAALLLDYRQTFLNVDMDVIKELEELFMLVWSNGDSYSGGNHYDSLGYGYGFGLSL